MFRIDDLRADFRGPLIILIDLKIERFLTLTVFKNVLTQWYVRNN